MALEALDADVRLNRSERQVTVTSHGVTREAYTEHVVRRNVIARFGWRVYDRRKHIIIDMYTDKSSEEDENMARADRPSGTDRAKREAERGLPNKGEIMMRLGTGGAHRFAQRFAPTTFRCSSPLLLRGRCAAEDR